MMFNDEELLVSDNKPITPALWPGAEGLVLAGQQPLQNPLKSYLASLPSPRSRQTVMERLRAVARLVEIEDAAAFPWHQLRFQHIDYIRARLIEKDPATEKRRSPATVNLTLAALRGIARYARNYKAIFAQRTEKVKVRIGDSSDLPCPLR